MTKNIIKTSIGLLTVVITLGSCNKEPDVSNLYTSTGETIESFIENDSNLTSFKYILQRTGLDRNMATYGQYTCYAPTNTGVQQYIDSLWNDPEAVVPHNGMTAQSLEGLSDSLCNDIARYHLTNGLYSIISMGGSGATITTMLGRPISSSVDTLGRTVLNGVSTIISEDNEVINGLVQVVNKVVPRTSRLLAPTMQRLEDYSIFYEALAKTGLADSVAKSNKGVTYSKDYDHTDTDGASLYTPTECKIGYTIFAESNAVMKANGINSFEDLVAYANKIYGGASSWYDYPREKGITISTGSDYTNRFNALNMFVAYHILYAAMAQDQMVFEDKPGVAAGTDKWNYVNGGEPYDYYETMLPHTLLKIWEPQPGKVLYINRWVLNNTLTDEVGTRGSSDMHPVKNPGIIIERTDITAYNGYIHPIKGMLVYDDHVPNGVLNERVRLDAETFLEELMNNGFRYMYSDEISALNGGGSGARVAYPVNYFDDVICYNGESTKLRTNVRGDYRAYQADTFQGWGQYDLAVRIPSMPSGLYEFRLFYSPMGHGGMMQFYWGKTKSVQDMQALSIPLDVRIQEDDPRIGWTAFYTEDDKGIASDEAMHNRGYMRGPFSFCGHPGDDGDQSTVKNCRGDGVVTLRRVLGRINLKQSDEFWFRFKSVINDDSDLKWQLDFVEFVPVSIVDNDRYSEDWY
ncbi:MAG: fasciclin domain-containing protein [Prevotella sp.]|nr:fasciclin domain-containing protein [Prevotella sp.]